MKSATSVGTLQMSMLTLDPENPETEAVLCNPAAAHRMIVRCSSKPGSALYLVSGARDDGRPVVIVQTKEPVDWSRLGKILAEEETEMVDLAQFEEGSQVRLEVVAAASRNRTRQFWKEGRVVTDPRSLARYANGLGLDPKTIKRLYREGLVWTWTLEDGTQGTYDEGCLPKEEQIVDEAACKAWFMQKAFAIHGPGGQATGELSVEFMSCLVGSKRILSVEHARGDKTTWMRPVIRRYSALVNVTNAEAFHDRLTRGVGRLKFYGAGLVLASLV